MSDQESISERASEISREINAPPSPEQMEAMRAYYTALHLDLVQQVSEIEAFLGFVGGLDDLAVRIAKIEKFLGVKG